MLWGRGAGERRPSGQEGLVWVPTVTRGLGQVGAPLGLSFPSRKKLGVLPSAWTLFWGLNLFLPLLAPLSLKDSLVHEFPCKSYRKSRTLILQCQCFLRGGGRLFWTRLPPTRDFLHPVLIHSQPQPRSPNDRAPVRTSHSA